MVLERAFEVNPQSDSFRELNQTVAICRPSSVPFSCKNRLSTEIAERLLSCILADRTFKVVPFDLLGGARISRNFYFLGIFHNARHLFPMILTKFSNPI